MADWSEGAHPRGALGRFIDVAPSGKKSSPRIREAQAGMLDWRRGAPTTDDSPVDNAYKRGSLWEGTPITKLPPEVREMGAEYQYAQGGFNDQLRAGNQPRGMAEMDSLIEANRLRVDTQVYRGMGDSVIPADAMPGDQIVDWGYSSTTLDPGLAANFGDDVLEIELPAGTAVAPLDRLNSYEFGHQKELVVGRGAVWEIDSVEPMPGDWLPLWSDERRLIRARLVGYVEVPRDAG